MVQIKHCIRIEVNPEDTVNIALSLCFSTPLVKLTMFFRLMYSLPLACINLAANKIVSNNYIPVSLFEPELKAGFQNDGPTNAITNSKMLDLFTEFKT